MKKRILLTLAIIAMLVCVFAISVSAAEYVDANGIKYVTNSDSTAYVADSRSTFSGTEAIIAEKITVDGTEYTVTSIANDAFSGESQLITLYIPATVTKIGACTFSGSTSIENIYINFENLTSVGERGLTTCTNSNSDSGYKATINFYDPSEYGKETKQTIVTANFKNITSIGAAAMQGLNVKNLILGENLTSMSKQCFRHATIESLNMETTQLTTFYHYAFNACTNLKTIVIKSAPTKIENDYFSQCSAVESIKIDLSKCTEVGGSAFEFSTGCQGGATNTRTVWYNLEGKNIVDLSSLKVINSEAFGTSNIGMASIVWPIGLTSIADQAFRKANITGTMYINAEEGKTVSMPYWAFNGNAPTTVILGKGVTKVSCCFEAQCTVVALADSVEFADKTVFSKSGSTLYYKAKTGTNFSNAETIQITSGTATNYGACGVVASLVTADGNVTVGETTHNYVLVDYDNTYCPINTMGNYKCSKCDGTKTEANEGTNPIKDGHAFNTVKSVVYEDGFLSVGVKTTVCTCTLEKTESVEAIFKFNGYSTKENDTAICVGYSINSEALKAYNDINEDLVFGVVASTKTENVLTNDNGTVTGGANTVVAPIAGDYASFDFILSGFSAEQNELALVMCAYAFDGEAISYMAGTSSSAPSTVTLKEIIESEQNKQ